MKYCSHCGKQLLDDAIICPGCGCSVQYGNNNGGDGFSKTNNYTQQKQEPPQVPPYADNYSAMSIAGLILSFFQPLVGLILSIIANNEAKRTGSAKSLSLSKAGIIISGVILGIIAAIILVYIIFILVLIFGLS